MESIYSLLTWGNFWLMLLCFVFLLTIIEPKRNDLRKYQNMRYILAWGVFFLMATANFAELTMSNSSTSNDIWYTRIITLFIGSCVAPVFSTVNITLINGSFFSWLRLVKGLIISSIFLTANIILLDSHTNNSIAFLSAYVSFIAYYVCIVLAYTTTFFHDYKKYAFRLNNYFSEPEANHLKWTVVTQLLATSSGIMAFVSLFMPIWWLCIFAMFLNILYPYYAIRFINYAFLYPIIAPVVEETELDPIVTDSILMLEDIVSGWENEKHFLLPDLNIETVARNIGTNRTYLSAYINTYKNKSFKEWISDLRISEAQSLLLAEPQTPVNEIGERVGFSDKGNFSTRFSKSAGMSPSQWRKTYLKSKKTEH